MELDGPQWRQLPLLMTHHEVASMHSGEFNVPVHRLMKTYKSGKGNRSGGDPGADEEHVHEIAGRIREHGYDERYPLVVRPRGDGDGDYLANGNHRAAAVVAMKHPLTPVTFGNPGLVNADQFRQERDDILSGARKPMRNQQTGLPTKPGEPWVKEDW